MQAPRSSSPWYRCPLTICAATHVHDVVFSGDHGEGLRRKGQQGRRRAVRLYSRGRRGVTKTGLTHLRCSLQRTWNGEWTGSPRWTRQANRKVGESNAEGAPLGGGCCAPTLSKPLWNAAKISCLVAGGVRIR